MFNKLFNEYINSGIKILFRMREYFKGNSSKKKTDLIEMIVYGWITDKLNNEGIEDISWKQTNQILNKSNITVKSLPGYGNAELKKKDIKPYVKEKPFIKI